jgi:hypothetical protein
MAAYASLAAYNNCRGGPNRVAVSELLERAPEIHHRCRLDAKATRNLLEIPAQIEPDLGDGFRPQELDDRRMTLDHMGMKNERLVPCGKLQHMRTFRLLALVKGRLGFRIKPHDPRLAQLPQRDFRLPPTGNHKYGFHLQPCKRLHFSDFRFLRRGFVSDHSKVVDGWGLAPEKAACP